MSGTERTLRIDAGDGTSFGATILEPVAAAPGVPVIVCGPAMGVRASFYRPLVEAWRDRGHPAVSFDLRGIGTSSVRASRKVDFGYLEVVELDYPALVDAVRQEFPGRPLVFQGHSLSGQFACLHAARHPDSFDRILLVATCSVYYEPWGRWLWLFLHFARTLSKLVGHFPGRRVGFGGREARGVVRDWSHQGLTGRYDLAGTDFDYEAGLADVSTPVHAVYFSDDTYAPRAAVEHLLTKLPDELTSSECLTPADVGADSAGHFDWVKSSPAVIEHLANRLSEGVRTPARVEASLSG